MKKLFIILTLIVSSITITSCTKTKSETTILYENISTYQTALYTSFNDDLEITLTTIYQESPLSLDGKVGKLKKDNKLSLKPLKSSFLNYEYEYTIVGSNGEIKGNLQKNLLGIAFFSEINDLEKIGEIEKVILNYQDKSLEFLLNNILKENCIDYKVAMEKAYEAFKEDLSALISSGNFDREIYIKLVKDNENPDSQYYWYVSFMKSSKEYYSALITLNGDVKNQRVKP